ncbi:glutathione S-transferase family protein [Pantoea sp. 1.19]|uniref:glutathione S-transferase family protein n=1 Tax=Pantoea sp. 1.19 TaxID=1925589 RepID=UPI000948DC30|nr:glutathione S-transferase [Pantoea sp. 1.19]
MITVHHLEKSRSHRILWLLEELEVPYQLKVYQREGSMLAPESLKKIHPLGKSPVITDDNRVVAESGAILEYLAQYHDADDRLTLADPDAQLQCRYWLHYAEGSLMPLLVMKLVFSRLSKPPVPLVMRPIGKLFATGINKGFLHKQLATHQRFIEAHLSRHPWFAGEHFSIADVQMSFPLLALTQRGPADSLPAIRAWLKKVEARPAWQRALDKGGPPLAALD